MWTCDLISEKRSDQEHGWEWSESVQNPSSKKPTPSRLGTLGIKDTVPPARFSVGTKQRQKNQLLCNTKSDSRTFLTAVSCGSERDGPVQMS